MRRNIFGLIGTMVLLTFSGCTTYPTQIEPEWMTWRTQVKADIADGRYLDALTPAQKELAAARAGLEPTSPDLARATNDLADVETQLGLFADGESHYREALRIDQQRFGAQSKEAAATLASLASNEEQHEQGGIRAEPDFKAALTIQQKLLPPGSPIIAVTMRGLGEIQGDNGQTQEALANLKQAAEIFESNGSASLVDLAHTLADTAYVLSVYGDNASALQDAERARTLLDRPGAPLLPELAWALSATGAVYTNMVRCKDAEMYYRRAETIYQRDLGDDSPYVFSVIGNLGICDLDLGKFIDAEEDYRRAVVHDLKNGQDSSILAGDYANWATVKESEDKFAEALTLLEKALAIDEKDVNPQPAATDMYSIATIYADLSEYAKAIEYMQKVLVISRKTLSPTSRDLAVSLASLGATYSDSGNASNDIQQFMTGADYLKQAIQIDIVNQDNEDLSSDVGSLGVIYFHLKDYRKAEMYLKQGIEFSTEALGPKHWRVGTAYYRLGYLYVVEKKYAAADKALRRARAILTQMLGSGHSEVISADIYTGYLYAKERRWRDADVYFNQAVEATHVALTGQFPYLEEAKRLGLLKNDSYVFPAYYTFCMDYYELDPKLAGDMYDVALWQKGMVARSIAALRARIIHSGDTEALQLLDDLSQHKTALVKLIQTPGQDAVAWKAEVDREQTETDSIEKELLARSQLISQATSLDNATWQDVRDALKPGEAAVEYLRFDYDDGDFKDNTPRYVALVITPLTKEAPVLIPLGKSKQLERAPVEEYSGRLRHFGAAPAVQHPTFYDAFWKPLLPALGQAKRVYVAPAGVLNQAALGIVADPHGQLLMQRYDLRIVTSTKDILRQNAAATSNVAVLVGNPTFDLNSAGYVVALNALKGTAAQVPNTLLATADVGYQSYISRDYTSGTKCPVPGTGILCPLPGTRAELDAVATQLQAHSWAVTAYTGSEALEEAVQGVTHPRLLHIATHGFFLPDQKSETQMEDPMLRSGLYFAGADTTLGGGVLPDNVDNGILTAYEASDLDLQGTDLVVLSACDTGLGVSTNGEGVFGLNRAFQEAGANAVMMSMWSVPDKETEELMTLFYTKLLSGEEKHAALRDAELAERDVVKQRYGKDLPYYWGAFVIVGR